MSTGILSNRLSFVRRHGFKAVGLAVLGMGIMLGGCNNKLKAENEELRSENAKLTDKLSGADSEKTAIASQLTTLQNDNSRLQSELIAKSNTTNRPFYPGDDEGGGRKIGKKPSSEKVLEISGDVLFASGQATLKPDAKQELNKLLPQIKSASTVRIEGHTDSDPIKKAHFASNQALSKARADAVRDYLVSKGVSRSVVTTIGKGATEPKATKKESRRVDIVIAE